MSSNNFLICLRWRLFAISRFNSRTARRGSQAEINFSLRQAQPQMLGPSRDWQSPAKFELAIKSQERQGNWANNSNQRVRKSAQGDQVRISRTRRLHRYRTPHRPFARTLASAARHPGVALAIASANFPQQKLAPAQNVPLKLVDLLPDVERSTSGTVGSDSV